MIHMDEIIQHLDVLCARLLAKEDWDSSKEAEKIKVLCMKHRTVLHRFVEAVERLEESENESK